MAQTNSSKKKTNSSSSRSGSSKRSSSRTASGTSNAMSDESMLSDFFMDELKDIYWAEKHLTKALPKLQRAANSQELQDAIAEHLEVTNEHISRLEQVFEMMGKKAQAKKCDAMEGITKEAQTVIEETQKGTSTRDAALIMAAQKAEHYEIATYGGLVQLAKTLGKNDVADLLGSTLEEEKQTDERLTEIAENNINIEASEETSEEMQMEEE
jgi:ferritin-like metal-binding protein YciE